MPVMRSYQCPECQGVFRHLHDRADEPPPTACEICGADTSGTPPELSAPHIPRSIGKVADGVYRQMEEGSRARAEMAAETLGESAADTGMAITDMRDNARPGETSAVPVNNPVSQFMGQTGAGGMTAGIQGAEYARATRTGPFAGAGAATLQGVVSGHGARAAQVAARGNVGR